MDRKKKLYAVPAHILMRKARREISWTKTKIATCADANMAKA